MQGDSLITRELVEDAHRDVEVVAGVRQRPQGLVERAEEVVPVDEYDGPRADRAHGLGPVLLEVALVLNTQLADAEVRDLRGASCSAPGTKPALPWTSIVRRLGRCSIRIDQASPHLYAEAFAGDCSGWSISPGYRSGGQWWDSISVTRQDPNSIAPPLIARVICSSASPWPWPMLPDDFPPTSWAPVSRATTAESMAWSKWVCTGTIASSRPTCARASAASIRARSGAILRSPTLAREGREKKPSVMIADVASPSRSDETPRNVAPNPSPASGRSKRSAYRPMSGRPSFSLMAPIVAA